MHHIVAIQYKQERSYQQIDFGDLEHVKTQIEQAIRCLNAIFETYSNGNTFTCAGTFSPHLRALVPNQRARESRHHRGPLLKLSPAACSQPPRSAVAWRSAGGLWSSAPLCPRSCSRFPFPHNTCDYHLFVYLSEHCCRQLRLVVVFENL